MLGVGDWLDMWAGWANKECTQNFDEKRPLATWRRKQEDNIKMSLTATGCQDSGGLNWLRIVSNGRVQY